MKKKRGKMIYVPFDMLQTTETMMNRRGLKNRSDGLREVSTGCQKWMALEDMSEDINKGFSFQWGGLFKKRR